MSDLTVAAAHYRRMAAAEHKPECASLGPKSRPVWDVNYDDGIPSSMRWVGVIIPRPGCPGCNPQTDRDLFARLADEIDAHLAPQPDLFGEMNAEPTTEETRR